jgi:RNA polymerase sigma-70 factor (ECF subfamily)
MVDVHFETVWRSLRRFGVDRSGLDDAAQHVFFVASRRLDEIERGGERQYLLGIALRVASEVRRKVGRNREVPIGDADLVEATAQDPDEALDQKRALALLATWVDEMPEILREAFVLFELEELNATDVARLLNIPVGTVASRVRRARKYIRQNRETTKGS